MMNCEVPKIMFFYMLFGTILQFCIFQNPKYFAYSVFLKKDG